MSYDNAIWRPRVSCYADENDDARTYYLPCEQLVLRGNNKLQRDFLRYCTGYFTMEEILTKLSPPYNSRELLELAELLSESGVLVDSREYWRVYHPYSNNPMPLFESLSDKALGKLYDEVRYAQRDWGVTCRPSTAFSDLLRGRQTTRTFSGEPLGRQEIMDLCWITCGALDAYAWEDNGLLRRTIPSAGALYPLVLHVLIRVPGHDILSGAYRYEAKLKLQTFWNNEDAFKGCFIDDTYVSTCSACFVISGNVRLECRKYGDRGYRYTILEAGHAAQNLQIFCAEVGLGCVEVGGFYDKVVTESLNLPDGIIPITAVCVGHLPKEDC